jgi:cob(I)alamin adenosyltransferase
MTKKNSETPQLGLIHVITGNGKGKTTSALGIALRAAGHGFKSIIIQYMKKGWDYGELRAIDAIPQITIHQYGTPDFIDKNKPKEIDFKEAAAALNHSQRAIFNEDWDIVILDEINIAIDFNLISEQKVVEIIKQKPKNVEIILTGRYASKELIDLADYYTEICEHKHPYQKGILARKGVEF